MKGPLELLDRVVGGAALWNCAALPRPKIIYPCSNRRQHTAMLNTVPGVAADKHVRVVQDFVHPPLGTIPFNACWVAYIGLGIL